MTKATQEWTRTRFKHHRFSTSERARTFGLHLWNRYIWPKVHTSRANTKKAPLHRYLNRRYMNQSNTMPGSDYVKFLISKSSNSLVGMEPSNSENGENGDKATPIFDSTGIDLGINKCVKKIKRRLIIAPDGYIPNSRIRSKIIVKPVHLASLRHTSSRKSKCEEIDHILFSQLVENGDDFSASHRNLRAQVDALIQEELPVFMRTVYQEEKYRIEGLLSAEGERSDPPHQIPTPRLPLSLNFMRKRALMTLNHQVKPAESQAHIESILNAPSETRRSPQPSGNYMGQTEFEELLGRMISHVGSRSMVYELVSGALKRDPSAVNRINEILGSRAARTPFLETICSPTYLFDFLASLLGSRAAVRISLSEILGGSINKLDELAAHIDCDAAITEFAGAFQEARREAIMIIQSSTPLSMSSSLILDMLIDGEESTEHIADLINGVDSRNQENMASTTHIAMPFQIAPEILEQVRASLITCDVKQLKELKVAKFSACQRYEERTERSISSLERTLLSEGFLATLKLKSLLASNTLVRDTLNEVIYSSQTSVFEPTPRDYIALVNKGHDFFIGRSDTPRPADEQVIDHFSNLTKRLRHVMAWSLIKEPLRGDLNMENFERVVRHALQVTETVTRQVIEYIAGAAKSRNIPEILQQAVVGCPEAILELKSFLGPGKSDFVTRTIQETRGQVVDRILRHCATNSGPEEVSGLLQRIHDETNCESTRSLIQSWIRLSLNISRLAMKLSVAKTAEKTRSLLHSAEIQEAQSHLTTKAKELTVLETALTKPSHIWPNRMLTVDQANGVNRVKSTRKRLIVKANTSVETRQSQTEAVPKVESNNDLKDDHTTVQEREVEAQLPKKDDLEQIRELESISSAASREYEEFVQRTDILDTADDVTEQTVFTFMHKPVKTDTKSVTKKTTDDLIGQKTAPLHLPSQKLPKSSTSVIEILGRLRKEYALIKNSGKTMNISPLDLRSKIERLRDEGLLEPAFTELSENGESDEKLRYQDSKEEVKRALACIENAIHKLTFSALIEQSSHQLPKKNIKFTRKLGFLRAGSTLLNETVSSTARRSKSVDQLKSMLSTSSRQVQPSEESFGLEKPSWDVISSSSTESGSTSSGVRATRRSQIERLNELQIHCQTSAAQLLMADQVTQETLILDEQGMQLRKFNTFFVENVRKFLGQFALAINQWGPDLEDDRDNRVSELKNTLIERMTEMTENFPEDIKEKLSAAIDFLVEDMHERLRKITESVPTEDWTLEKQQQQLPEELTNQVMKSVASIFYYRVRPITREWKGLESTEPITAERINEMHENSISRLKNLVEGIRNELMSGNTTPPLVISVIDDQLNQLRKEVQTAIKVKCKEIIKESKLLARQIRHDSERHRVSMMVDKLSSEDQIKEDQQASTVWQDSIVSQSERKEMPGEMPHTSVPPPKPATESVLGISSRPHNDGFENHLTHPNVYAPRKTEKNKQLFDGLEKFKTLESPARSRVVHAEQLRITPITRHLTNPKTVSLRVRENLKIPLIPSPDDTSWDANASEDQHQGKFDTKKSKKSTRKLFEYMPTDIVSEQAVSEASTFLEEEKTRTESEALNRIRKPLLRAKGIDAVLTETETENIFINQEMGIFVKGLEIKRLTPAFTYSDTTLPNVAAVSEAFLPEVSSLVEPVSSTRPSVSPEISHEISSVTFQLESPETFSTKSQRLSHPTSVSEKLWERTSFNTDTTSPLNDTSGISLSTRRSSGADEKPVRRKKSCLPPIVSLPPKSRVVTRPSYIPCHEWAKMIGPRNRQTVRYDIDPAKESQLKRAEELHMSSSSLRRHYDMLGLFHEATLVQKYRNRLPPIQ